MDLSYSTLNKSLQKTQKVLMAIADELNWRLEHEKSYAALKVVLHALRDRLPINEAVQLGAQFPIVIRGVYYEGWNPAKVPIKMKKQDFIDRVHNEYDFGEVQAETIVRVVLQALSEHISEGEMEDIELSLPKSLRELFP